MIVTLIGISLFTFTLLVGLPLLEKKYGRKGKKYFTGMSKWFTKLKLNCMSKKSVEPKKNKPTKKKSSAQKKADPKKKLR